MAMKKKARSGGKRPHGRKAPQKRKQDDLRSFESPMGQE